MMGKSISEELCEPVFLEHRTCITDLPNDSLYLIFEKLNNIKNQNSFGRTCHRFLNIQNLSRKCLKVSYRFLSSDTSDKLLSRFRQLESLFLTGCGGVLDLSKLQMYGSRLHSLDLSLCSNVTDTSIALFASGCPSLSVISLYKCSITDNGLEILTSFCTSLKRVDLTFCFNISYHGISYLNQNCRQLRALRIAGHAFKGFSTTLLNRGGCLECLHFTSPMIGPLGHELSIIGLGFAANLKILNFKHVKLQVHDEIILQIAKGCPMLTEWDLSCCYKITTSGWESIGLHCQNLEILHVTKTSLSNTGKGLVALGNGCRRLSVIYMKTDFHITPNWMHMFKTQRPDVEIINEEAKQIAHSWVFIK